MESAPFDPLVYWPHVVFGIGSALLVLVAVFSAKGSGLHRKSGQLFAISMGIAALTAISFSFIRPSPLALFSAVSVIYGIGAGILALRQRKGAWRALEYILTSVPVLLIFGAIALSAIGLATAPEEIPAAMLVLTAIVTVILCGIFGYYAWTDYRYLRAEKISSFDRFRRHALRMALAAAETVRAPLISFGPPIFGEATGAVYFFGPFIIIPLIYFGAMPDWIRKSETQKLSDMKIESSNREARARPV